MVPLQISINLVLMKTEKRRNQHIKDIYTY